MTSSDLPSLIREFNHTWIHAATQTEKPDPILLADICKKMIFDLTGEVFNSAKPTRHNSVAEKLRAAGYTCLPRWWLSNDNFELVKYMAFQDLPHVQALRLSIKGSSDDRTNT